MFRHFAQNEKPQKPREGWLAAGCPAHESDTRTHDARSRAQRQGITLSLLLASLLRQLDAMEMPEELRASVAECDLRLQALEAALEPLLGAAGADAQVSARAAHDAQRGSAHRKLTACRASFAQLEPLERAQMQLTLAHAATVVFTSASPVTCCVIAPAPWADACVVAHSVAEVSRRVRRRPPRAQGAGASCLCVRSTRALLSRDEALTRIRTLGAGASEPLHASHDSGAVGSAQQNCRA
jgi:hypothetical protein